MSAQLVVAVRGQRYTLPIELVLEVTRVESLTPVPGAAAGVLGVQNLRGRIMPVLDTAALLGLGSGGAATRAVVVECPPIRAALAVDVALDLLEDARAVPAPGSPTVPRVAMVGGEPLGMIDLPALLAQVQESLS
jgi:purine-binding chemotaxis protein CheW